MSNRRTNDKKSRGRQTRKRKNPPTKKTNLVKTLVSHVEPKYFDLTSLANSIGAGSTLFLLSNISQGAAQTNRVGDFVQPLKLSWNFTLYTVNSDIVTTVRIIFFRWVPSTAFLSPAVANILENPVAANTLAHFNFQTQDNYQVLWERQFACSGVTTAPTTASNFGGTGLVIPLKGRREIEFTLGATTATNHIWLLAISDSALTPFPLLSFVSRLYFEDTVHAGSPSKMPK